MDAGRSFSWTLQSPGIRSVALHRVDSSADGCLVTLEIRQAGRLAGLTRLLFGGLTKRYMRTESEGLKQRVES